MVYFSICHKIKKTQEFLCGIHTVFLSKRTGYFVIEPFNKNGVQISSVAYGEAILKLENTYG